VCLCKKTLRSIFALRHFGLPLCERGERATHKINPNKALAIKNPSDGQRHIAHGIRFHQIGIGPYPAYFLIVNLASATVRQMAELLLLRNPYYIFAKKLSIKGQPALLGRWMFWESGFE